MTDRDRPRAADQTIFTRGIPVSGPGRPESEWERADALLGVSHGMTLPPEEDVVVGSPGCQRCEVLPAPVRGPGTILLRLPHTYTLGKILSFLSHGPWPHHEREGVISIVAPVGSLAPVLSPIAERLTPVEQNETRVTFQPAGQPPRAAPQVEIDSLPAFVTKVRGGWLLDILRERRLRTVFHPILFCGNGATPAAPLPTVYGYKCLMRAQVEDDVVMPGPMIEMARRADLVFQLDLAARRAAITGAAACHIQCKVFVNFMPNAIFNPESCLESTVRLIDEVGLTREQVVFEITESERLPESTYLKQIVDYYREHHFGVALDDVGAGFSSLGVLLAVRPDYVKIDMSLTRNVHLDADKALVASKLLETVQGLGMQTIAEGIEQPEELAWCTEHGVDFVQGFLFARPADPPPL